MNLWPQFRSPLVWDVFAVGTYLTVSLIFWYIGIIPDLATMRDKAKSHRLKVVYGLMCFGWRGSAKHWQRYKTAYLMLAGLATPLVISVHSVVGLDFTAGIVPGWHSTMLSPYFVAGAIFSGFAMVLTLGIPIRHYFKLQDYITIHHLENCAKLMLLTGLIVDYSYLMEYFFAWYSDNPFEMYIEVNRALGQYWYAFAVMMFCNVLTPQLVWFKKIRTNVTALFIMSLVIQVGMWTERFVIVVQSLHRDFMPDMWHMYYPTKWDLGILFGSMGFFMVLFLLFVRTLPVISISELLELIHKSGKLKKESP
jgi:molybdopterin-containing oxidoreductase family membrane subunit